MSVSSLPEWKQLLLEKKRREEEERDRREKEMEEKLASMPAWKRGIIQRRKAKQDTERDRDVCFLQVDFRSPSDGLSDTDSSITVNLGSDLSLSPDPGLWLDADPRSVSQVSVETIVPLHENPFIRTQSTWRKGARESDMGSEPEREKSSPKSQDGEPVRGRDVEQRIERFRDLSEGRDKERSQDRSQGRERENSWKEPVKDVTRERDFLKVRKEEEERNTDSPSGPYSPLVPCLRTIRADNIIIIEQDRKGNEERRARWREAERERSEEEQQQQGNRGGMKVNLREILAGGGSVTEIRASEVLIIKPSDERNAGEVKDARREGREVRTDMSWLKDKERPWGQATVIKDDQRDSLEDNVFVERGGRVSQLLSKFGEVPKPPSRSKSSDNMLRPRTVKYSDEDDQQSEERKTDRRSLSWRGVPKRSFSFSDRVLCANENGLDDERCRMRDRVHSDKSVPPWVDVAALRMESKIKLGCARLLEKDRLGKHRDGYVKIDDNGGAMHKWTGERSGNGEGDEGFTVASIKTKEAVSFARRVPIRQDGKVRAEREAKRLMEEKRLEREASVEKGQDGGHEASNKKASDYLKGDGLESAPLPENMQGFVMVTPGDTTSLSAESHCRHESAFTECSTLLCTVTDRARDPYRGSEWSAPRGPVQTSSVLSQHTEELISKIERIGGHVANELTKENRKEGPETHDTTPRSPKRVQPPGPLEIQIPRTVFYVAEEAAEAKKMAGPSDEGREWEKGQGVERRDSWRIGKPLSRIESLREKIRQKELEKLKQKEEQDGEEGGATTEVKDSQRPEDRSEVEGPDVAPEELEAAAHVQRKQVEANSVQEDATAAQASAAALDVTEEVLKTCPLLPVLVPHSQAVEEEEVSSGYVAVTSAAAAAAAAVAAAESTSDSSEVSEVEDDPQRDELKCHQGQLESREEEKEEEREEEEERELSEEEAVDYPSPPEPLESVSLSPPHPNSLAAMSRIYNLETVGSRSGLCLRERSVDIPPVQLLKVRPHVSNLQQTDGKVEDVCGVQTIQRQIEQFQLKEQEARNKSCTSPNNPLRDRETKRQQSPRGLLKHQVKDEVWTQERHQPESKYTHRTCSPTAPLVQTTTVHPLFPRSQSPDNFLKPCESAPTPASSPSSPSPAQSPSISPSPSPSPTLFSIRSASGGQVKRGGATITISPKRNVATGGGGGGSASSSPSMAPSPTGSNPAKAPSQQVQTPPGVTEPARKKYPTAEEIEVIGGYLNLEKSCLVKNRGNPKRVNVYFDEDQLEQVCEYPSETSMLAPPLHDMEWQQVEGEAEPDGGGGGGAKSTKSVVGLRVDESCPRPPSPKLPL